MPWLEIERLEENAQFFSGDSEMGGEVQLFGIYQSVLVGEECDYAKEFFLETEKTCYTPDWWFSDWKRKQAPPLSPL